MVPMTRLMQGWTITNGLAVLWADGTVDQVSLDTPGMGFADATDVAFTPDGRYARPPAPARIESPSSIAPGSRSL